MPTTDLTAAVLNHLTADEPAAIDRLIDWLRIPSISTDPKYKADVARAADWAADHLRASGFDTRVLPTGKTPGDGHPIVLATSPGATGYTGPHVLFYGHYDVQPVDPENLWAAKPFDPQRKPAEAGGPGERLVARGASDDKGQVAMFLEAARAWHTASGLAAGGVKMTVLLEGEEESGSVNLERFVAEHAEELKRCDVCLISDTGMLARGRPAITYGVRGLAYTEVTLHGPSHDLHSGMWGGKIPNPINELTKILARLWDSNRRITIPGFYEGVRDLAPEERANWKNLGTDEAAALKGIGFPPEASVGEAGFTMTEREWARPTAEINGIWGGYTGHGAKTVIPTSASAKVSFRLVDDQDHAKVCDAFFGWLQSHTPPGCKWTLTDHGGGAPVTCAIDSPTLTAARKAVEQACGVAPAMIKTGGSIPVAGLLKTSLGIETIFMGFGLDDDRVHSPNEKFELDCYRMGARSHAVLMGLLLEGAAG
jgi:acetylornithine deacetylase/succinyl-diaminopimelate desuccinylase-like protein